MFQQIIETPVSARTSGLRKAFRDVEEQKLRERNVNKTSLGLAFNAPKLKYNGGTLQPGVPASRTPAESSASSDPTEKGPGFSNGNSRVWDLQG